MLQYQATAYVKRIGTWGSHGIATLALELPLPWTSLTQTNWLHLARLWLQSLIHSHLPPAPLLQFGYHLRPLDKTGNTDSFWERWSSALLLSATEISSQHQSHNKFKLPYMVCDFVIYISYGCSSHMDDFHFTFSIIYRLKLCPFLPQKGKADPSTLHARGGGEREKECGRGRGKKEGFTDLQSCRGICLVWGSIQPREKLRRAFNEFYCIIANCVCNLTNAQSKARCGKYS